jgi:hypothetical protein
MQEELENDRSLSSEVVLEADDVTEPSAPDVLADIAGR